MFGLLAVCSFVTLSRAQIQGTLYWSDSTVGLVKQDFTSSVPTVLLPVPPIQQPLDVVVSDNYLYWVDDYFSIRTTGRCQVNYTQKTLTNCMNVVTPGTLVLPKQVAVDRVRGKVFSSDTFNNIVVVNNLDGSGQQTIFNNLFNGLDPMGLAVDENTGDLYITVGNVLQKMSPPYSQVSTVVTMDATVPERIQMGGNGRIYWYSRDNTTFKSCLLNGSEIQVWASKVSNVVSFAISRTTGQLFYATQTTIWRAALDGSALTQVVSSGGQVTFSVSELAIDEQTGTLLWVDSSASTIWASALDGSNPYVIFRPLVRSPGVLTFDETNSMLYFVDTIYNKIFKVNPAFSTPPVAIYTGQQYQTITSIAVDARVGYIFFTTSQHARRINLDGSQDALIYTGSSSSSSLGGMQLDRLNSKIYFVDTNSDVVRSFNYDGSGASVVFNQWAARLNGAMVADFSARLLFLVDDNFNIIKTTIGASSSTTFLANSCCSNEVTIGIDTIGQTIYYGLGTKIFTSSYNSSTAQVTLFSSVTTYYDPPVFAIYLPSIPCATAPNVDLLTDFASCSFPMAHGSSCTLGCAQNYTANQLRQLRPLSCVSGGFYPILGQCVPFCPSLPSLALATGYLAGTCTAGMAQGVSCALSCDVGYNIDPSYSSLSITCQAPGWSTPTGSCKKKCSATTYIGTGNILTTDCPIINSGSACVLRCAAGTCGYPTWGCNNGLFNPVVINGCGGCPCSFWPAGVTSQGPMTYGTCYSNLPDTSVCTTACVSPYIASGSLSARCNNGVWVNPTGSCVLPPGACATLPTEVVQGQLAFGTCRAPSVNGTSCSMACVGGGVAQGSLATWCLNGAWTPAAAACNATTSPIPTATTSATVATGSTSAVATGSSTASITTGTSSVASGTAKATTTPSNKPSTLSPGDCTKAPNVPMGATLGACTPPVRDGATCVFTCKQGLFSVGAFGALCRSGEWTVFTGYCGGLGTNDGRVGSALSLPLLVLPMLPLLL